MKAKAIQVPVALLLDPALTPAAKLVWVAAAMGPGSPTLLADRAALTRQTVGSSLARLAAAGWKPGCPAPAPAQAPAPAPAQAPAPASAQAPAPALRSKMAALPISLVEDRSIGAQAKILYAVLQLTPEPGRFTYAALSALTHTDARPLKTALAQLAQAGWVDPAQKHKHAPVTFTLTRPRQPPELVLAKRRYRRAQYKGEALMREFLTLLVDRDDYADDAAPDFLANPLTDQPLELDRFYPPDVGFEFQGPQHYRETEIYTEAQAKKQRARDYIKAGLCADNHVTLILIHADDLTLEAMQQKLPPHLPRRDLAGHGDLIRWLSRKSAEYQEDAAN